MTEATDQVTITRWGGPDVLTLKRVTRPEPGPGEVRIAVEASSLSYTDMLIRRGIYPGLRQRPPLVTGYTCVGRIDKLGAGVEDWSVGDRVADLTMTGGAATHVIRSAASVVRVPNGIDAAQAEVMVLTYLTAYQALHRTGDLASGEPVLVMGASGAVGHGGVDLARVMGCPVTGVASQQYQPFVKGLGGAPIAYDLPDYWDKLSSAAQAVGGYQVILDPVGEISARRMTTLLRPGGRLVWIGFAGRIAANNTGGRFGGIAQIINSVAQAGFARISAGRDAVSIYNIAAVKKDNPSWFAEDLTRLFSWLEAGELTPCIAERYPFAEARAGHEALQAGDFAGRLVLTGDLVARQDPEASEDHFATRAP